MKKYISMLLSAVMMIASCSSAFATIVGPDYDWGDNGWTITTVNTDSSYTLDFEEKHSGNASLVTEIPVGQRMEFTPAGITYETSTVYKVSFWIKAENADVDNTILRLTSQRASNQYPASASTFDWTYCEYEYTSRSSGLSPLMVRFQITNPSGSETTKVWIDDMSVAKVTDGVAGENIVTNPGFEEGIDVEAPAAVTNLEVIPDDGVVSITWTDSVSSDATGVVISLDGQEYNIENGVQEKVFEDLSSGETYSGTIVAIDEWENKSEPIPFEFIPYARREAPAVTADDDENVILGIDDSMEYQLDGGEWVAYTEDTVLDLSGCHFVNVRYPASGFMIASFEKLLVFYTNVDEIVAANGAVITSTNAGVTIKGTSTDSTVNIGISPIDAPVYTSLVFARVLNVTNGKYEITFDMPDWATRNTYRATITSENADEPITVDFTYVSKDETGTFAASLTGMTTEEVLVEITDPANQDVISQLGIDMTEYNAMDDYSILAEELKNQENADAETFASSVIHHTVFDLISKATKPADVAGIINKYNDLALDLTCEGESWNDITSNERIQWISEFLMEDIASEAELEALYNEANMYYQINASSGITIENTFKKFETELGLTGNTYFADYLAMSVGNRKKVGTAFKNVEFSYKDAATVVSNLERAVKAVQADIAKQSTDTGNSNSSGPSGAVQFPAVGSGNVKVETDDPKVTIEAFRDIKEVDWAEEAINELYKQGKIAGMGDGYFKPNNAVTREQMAKLLLEALSIDAEIETTEFNDVEFDRWSFPSIMTMKSAGIIKGYENGSFAPEANITREDLAVMLVRACEYAGYELKAVREVPAFADAQQISGYAKASIEKLYAAGILNGVDEDTISPKGTATRAMAAKLIYSVIGKEV